MKTCRHPRVVYRKHGDDCTFAVCAACGQRGPRKHTRSLALTRLRSTGGRFRGCGQPVRYTGTAARDDRRFATKEQK